MLRENSRALWLGWMLLYAAVAGAAFIGLSQVPGFQRIPTDPAQAFSSWLSLLAVVVLGWPLILKSFGVFESQRREPLRRQAGRLAVAHITAAGLLATTAFALDGPVNGLFPIALAGVLFTFQTLLHGAVFLFLHRIRRAGRNFRNIIVIGSGPRAATAVETIENHPEWGYHVCGFLDEPSHFAPSVDADLIYTFSQFPELVRNEVIDEVLVACPRSMIGQLDSIVGICMTVGIEVTMLTDLFGSELPPARAGAFGDVHTLSFAPVHHNPTHLAVKRSIDLAGAVCGLLVALPVIALAAAAIGLTSSGPIFFRQTRAGRNGRSFEMLKLRTMVPDAEAQKSSLMSQNELDGPVFKITNDPRITPVGRTLRKFSIDELPQFWNVLRGEMSLVGPRPPTPDEVLQYQASERRRLSMRPGLTCLWQVSGRNQIGFEDWMKLDLQYIDDWSVLNDLQILARTIPAVLLGKGAA